MEIKENVVSFTRYITKYTTKTKFTIKAKKN